MLDETQTWNWDEAKPSPATWEQLQVAQESDFPRTYAGTAWLAAWKLMKVAKEQPERFASWDGWTSDPLAFEVTAGLDLTGLMFGYAINALRFMLELPPVADGATVVIGGGSSVRPMNDTPNAELGNALGGAP